MSERGRGRARGRSRGRGSIGRGRSNDGRDSTRNDTRPVGGLSTRPSETPHSVGQAKQSNPKATPTSTPSAPKPEPTAPTVALTPKRDSNGPVTQRSPNASPSSGSPSSTSSPSSSSCIGSSVRSSPQSLHSASPITVSGASSSSKLDSSKLDSSPLPSFKYQDPPQRPGVGTLGRPIDLQTNHFPITFPRRGELYHYDVTLKPDTCPRKINRLVIKEIEKKYRENLQGILLAYDGTKNIYTSKPLPFQSKV